MSEREAFVNEKIAEINNELNNEFLTAERREELTRDRSSFENELEQIRAEKQVRAEQEQAAQLRIQAQGIRVESIELPHNYSELFDDPRANSIIIEVIKGFQRQANEEHNEEIESLIGRHREELRAAADRELQLKRQNDEMQKINEASKAENAELTKLNWDYVDQVSQLKLEKEDAESKRDAAVAKAEGLELLLSEKEAHIQTLRDEAALGARNAINVTSIGSSDLLTQLVEESKNDRINKIKSAADIALENAMPFRGKVTLDTSVAPKEFALGVPTFLQTAGNVPFELDKGPMVEQFRSENAGCELAIGNASGEMAAQENMGAASIEERVAALEAHVFGFVKGQEVA